MATPAEKKALLFLGVVTLLGGGVRLWRSYSAGDTNAHGAITHPKTANGDGVRRSSGKASSAKRSTSKSPKKKSRAAQAAVPPFSPLDLDVATVAEIEALGVLKPGVARMIVANRDSFGAFGSIRALERVPYLRKTTITTLAPLVTFSQVPRPLNAVLQPSRVPAHSLSSPLPRTRQGVRDSRAVRTPVRRPTSRTTLSRKRADPPQ